MTSWYPLKLTPYIRTYTFGERLIPEHLHKQGLPDGLVAETWEVSDFKGTTGIVTNGALAGRSLHDLTMAYPDEVVGLGWRGPHFPLLAKFLDASHPLPVHLHADDETAERLHKQPNGKTEAWHILWAAPGASILAGIKPGFSREDLFQAFVDQDYDRVMPRFPIQSGDTVYVPGGVIHSFGPDTLIFEIQQTSDLSQMVMPVDLYGKAYGEKRWHTNINATLDELRTDYQPRPHHGLTIRSGANRRTFGCASPFFALEHWTLAEPYLEPAHPGRCTILANVGDPVQLEFVGGTEILHQGESCILPAALGAVQIAPGQAASLVVSYVPNLERDVVEPLQAAGFSDQEIMSLGELKLRQSDPLGV